MHVHPPKPPHSWQDLAREIGVIVLGVLIALGFEQVAETVHWNHAVKEGREALHREIARNNHYFSERAAFGPCIDAHVQQTRKLIDYAATHGRTLPASKVSLKTGYIIETSEWEAQKAAQALVHFPAEERSALSTYYSLTVDIGDWREQEGQYWDGLAVLDGPSRPIGEGEIATLRALLVRAQHINRLWTLNAKAQIKRAAALGVEPLKGAKPVIPEGCEPIQIG